MSLSAVLRSAQNSISNIQTQTSVVGKNISNASNADYNRRSAILSSTWYGAEVITIERSQNEFLVRNNIEGISSSSGQNTVLAGLENLKSIFGGNDYEMAPATLITSFRDSLSTFAAKPSGSTLAEAAIADAKLVAQGLRDASQRIQDVRKNADEQIAIDVETLNDLLAQFEDANNAVIGGTRAETDINADLDERDKLLKKIAEIIPVSVVNRDSNDMALYTASGLTLFETIPRSVTFSDTAVFDATVTGNAIYVDGTALPAGNGAATDGGGTLQAHLQIRDDYAPKLQSQLDEIARGLITQFAESDQSASPTLPDMPGLFTWSGGTVPAAGTLVNGLAASISVNTAVQTSMSGNPKLLRDGGINGAAYVVNTSGSAGFSTQLDNYVRALDATMTFDTAVGLGTSASLIDFSTDSLGWLEQQRSDASVAAESKAAYQFRTTEALSNQTGVSIDEEMSLLLELEQSYKASARLITAVDEMLKTLLAAA